MSLKRVGDLPQEHVCQHSEHNPPAHIVLRPGVYEHTCPGCKRTLQFSVYPTHMVERPYRFADPVVDDGLTGAYDIRPWGTRRRSIDRRPTWLPSDA